jgi:hypothetical protein
VEEGLDHVELRRVHHHLAATPRLPLSAAAYTRMADLLYIINTGRRLHHGAMRAIPKLDLADAGTWAPQGPGVRGSTQSLYSDSLRKVCIANP